MNLSRLFIERPVMTALVSFSILLFGVIAFRALPVAALPSVDYPTIQVNTFYPGASPEVMTGSVTAPLERQFGQMPGLEQMTSTANPIDRILLPWIMEHPWARARVWSAPPAGGV